MTLKKLELKQETVQNLTRPFDSQREGVTLTFPPACENTGNCKVVF